MNYSKHIENERLLLEFCVVPRSRNEMMHLIGAINESAFLASYTRPMQKAGKLKKIGVGKKTMYQTVEADTDEPIS